MKLNMKRLMLLVYSLALISPHFANAQPKKAIKNGSIELCINYKQATPRDTLVLRIGTTFIADLSIDPIQEYTAVQNSKGFFIFKIPVIQKGGYFDIYTPWKKYKQQHNGGNMPITELLFWEIGDKINIEIDHREKAAGINSKSIFKGKNAAKYTARQELTKHVLGIDKNKALEYFKRPKLSDSIMKRLAVYKSQMSSLAYRTLENDILYKPMAQYIGWLVYNSSTASKDKSVKQIFDILDTVSKIDPDKDSYKSEAYLHYKYAVAKLLSIFDKSLQNNILNSILKSCSGITKELLIITYFKKNQRANDTTKEYNTAVLNIKNPTLHEELQKFGYQLAGLQWKDYILTDTNGINVKLSQFEDKIVLVDFWFTGCGYCSNYYNEVLSKVKQEFKDTNVAFVSISLDRNFEGWKKSISDGLYTDRDVHNLYTSGLGFQHPVAKENGINGAPIVILFNKKRILYQYNTNNLYKIEELKSTLNTLLAK